MLSFSKLCNQNVNFTRLSGIKLGEFWEIVERSRPDWIRMQKKKISGQNSHLKTLEDEILLVLIFYRFYATHEFLS
ncbi:MAG: hypothetical protein LBE95_01440 [Holosporaceae bacterium]|nr:hypothetical protein [Holosporaceae bacterium]